MANSLKRPLRRDTASAYGAWGGISNYVDAACAAVHSIAVRPVSCTALSRRMCLGWLPRRRAILAAATTPHHPTVRMHQAPALLARLVSPVTWPLPSSLSPLSCLAACEFLRAEGSPQPWLPVTRFSVRKAVLVLLSPSLPNSLHSSRLTIAPRFQNVAVPPNSWPTSVRAARQENAVCPALSPPALGSSVRKAFLASECVSGTACVQIECSRTAWVHLAPSKAY